MREILFRGKRADNGEWAEGQLLYFKSSVGAEEFALIVESCEWDNANEWFNLGKRAKLIPETVGQFTGLTDKNGKKIFEDDIIKVTDDNGKTNLCSCGIGYVCFCYGVWYIEGEVNDGLYDVKNIYYIEVIGNIHDNPELLKGGKAK